MRVVTDEHDVPIGFSAVIDRGDAVELDGLFVAPEWMRHGLGGALVADVVTRAGAAGARADQVVANPGAVPFYKRHGFRQTRGDRDTVRPGAAVHARARRRRRRRRGGDGGEVRG